MPLIMCVTNHGCSCLLIAAQNGHTAVVEVGAGGGDSERQEGVCWQRRHTARGAGAVGSTLQHAAPRCNTLQHAVPV